MDPYWGSVLLNMIRFVLAIIGLPIMVRFKKKTVYLICCVIVSLGTSLLATYSYLNIDDTLTLKYPWSGYIPLIGIILLFGGYAFGLGTIPFMLQVKITFLKNFTANFSRKYSTVNSRKFGQP